MDKIESYHKLSLYLLANVAPPHTHHLLAIAFSFRGLEKEAHHLSRFNSSDVFYNPNMTNYQSIRNQDVSNTVSDGETETSQARERSARPDTVLLAATVAAVLFIGAINFAVSTENYSQQQQQQQQQLVNAPIVGSSKE